MIKFQQFNKKYTEQVYKLIYNIMIKELKINSKILPQITKDLKNIKNKYIEKGGNFWIAIDTDKDIVIGTIGILKIDNKNAELKRFYVDESYRNNHIGYELYKMAEFYAKNINIENLYLVTSKMSKKALNIYLKNDWEQCKDINTTDIFVRRGAMLYVKVFEEKEYIKPIYNYSIIIKPATVTI